MRGISMLRVGVFLASCALLASTGEAADVKAVVRDAKAAARREVQYQVGSHETFSLARGEGVHLVCSPNPLGLTDVYFSRISIPTIGDCVMVWWETDVGGSGGGEAVLARHTATLKQVARSHYLVAAQWQRKGTKIEGELFVENDPKKSADLYQECKSRRNVNMQLSNPKALTGKLDAKTRAAIVEKLWKAANDNFAFFDARPNLDWNKVLPEYRALARKEQSLYDFSRLMQKMYALLGDGHTEIYSTSPPGGWGAPALLVRKVEGKAVVVDLAESDQLKAAGIKKGTVITSVDGRPFERIVAEALPYYGGSPQWRDRRAYSSLLWGEKDSTVSVGTIALDGAERIVSLTRTREGRKAIPFGGGQPFEYRELPGQIAYVAVRTFTTESVVDEFEKVFDQILESRGLVIDVRENNGGSGQYAFQIVSHLTDKPLAAAKSRIRVSAEVAQRFNYSGVEDGWVEYDPDIIQPVSGKKPFLGPVVVLISEGTVSAAEDFLIPLDYAGRATLVGSPTAGTTGMNIPVYGGFNIGGRVCFKHDMYPDGREFVGVGVMPDIEVHPTLEDIAAGRDAVLERGIEVLQGIIDGA